MARSARELFEEAMRLEIERRIAERDSGAVAAVPSEELRARLGRR
jgi:hypothetical protein